MALLEQGENEAHVAPPPEGEDAPSPSPSASPARPRRPPPAPRFDFSHVPTIAFAAVAVGVLAFSRAWVNGRITLDGIGAVMFVREALNHWFVNGRIPYWLAEMWGGTPLFGLAPSLPTLDLVPLASVFGPELAVRIAILGGQIVAGWGAYVLAGALWGKRTPAAAVAGFVYALHPLFITHGALFGHQPSIWVMASTPWLVWSWRRALREPGSGYVAVAGAVAGFAVLQQAEHAYALVVMCACMVVVELARSRRREGGPGCKPVLARAAAATGVGFGLIAFWLLPFITLSKSFLLTPPAWARAELTSGLGGVLGRHPAAWLTRSRGLDGVVGFEDFLSTFSQLNGLSKGAFYFSWVCMVLTMVTIIALPRHDRDGHLTAIVFASAVSVWLSAGGVSLASSQLVADRRLVSFAVLGVLGGFLVNGFLRQLRLKRVFIAGVLSFAFLVAMPYLTPFLTLQELVPFLANIRSPRFYPVAALALALGAAYPLVLFQRWVTTKNRSLAPMLTVAACLAVVGAFLVDIAPYRSYYRLRPPNGDAAYAQAARSLEAASGGAGEAGSSVSFRVAPVSFGDPRPASELLKLGQTLSVGWPHPMASRQAWRVTGEAFFAPAGFRNKALGLAGTAYFIADTLDASGKVDRVLVVRNPDVLPIVRAYDSVVVVDDDEVAPELAATLAAKHLGVVSGGADVARQLGPLSRGQVGRDVCNVNGEGAVAASAAPVELTGEVAMACAAHRWIGVYIGLNTVPVGRTGGVFTAPIDGLKGLTVWLDRPAVTTEVVIQPVNANGELGPVVAQAFGTGGDSGDVTTFVFDPIANSAGQRYVFNLSCPRCAAGEEPRMVVADALRGPGQLFLDDHLDPDRVAAFSLVYDGMPSVEASSTRLGAVTYSSGTWRVQTSGERPSVVVVAAAWFPGWEARVDGKRAPVLVADGAFLGVAVPAGEHQVTLVYKKPAAAGVGLAVTAGTLLGVILFLPSQRRRRRRAASGPASPAGG